MVCKTGDLLFSLNTAVFKNSADKCNYMIDFIQNTLAYYRTKQIGQETEN